MTNLQLNKQIEQVQREAELKIQELRKAAIRHSPEDEMALAELLHSSLCTADHTDVCAVCGWFYDFGDWASSTRQGYLAKARKLRDELPNVTFATYQKLFRIVKEND